MYGEPKTTHTHTKFRTNGAQYLKPTVQIKPVIPNGNSQTPYDINTVETMLENKKT